MTGLVIILAHPNKEIELVDCVAWLRRWIPALIVLIAIFWASSIPASQIPNAGKWDWLLKKGAHFTGYALLALALLRGTGYTKKRGLFWVLLFCGLYAASDEFHQSFVSGRNPSPIDVGIDILGASIASAVFIRYIPLRRLVLG